MSNVFRCLKTIIFISTKNNIVKLNNDYYINNNHKAEFNLNKFDDFILFLFKYKTPFNKYNSSKMGILLSECLKPQYESYKEFKKHFIHSYLFSNYKHLLLFYYNRNKSINPLLSRNNVIDNFYYYELIYNNEYDVVKVTYKLYNKRKITIWEI